MSLTSYRAAPSRDILLALGVGAAICRLGFSVPDLIGVGRPLGVAGQRQVNGFVFLKARASMPGDDLLFRGLSHSTIGAVWFHGRVRDGIGWVTDAMVTKL